jgi:hypothetical protein
MDRANYFPQTNVLKAKQMCVSLQGAGSGKAPTLLYGDPNATYFSQPAFVSTGIWTITTLDPYPGWVSIPAPGIMQATGAGTLTIQQSPKPSQLTTASGSNPVNAWKFTFNTFVSGSLSDMLAGDQASLVFVMSNSSVAT